MEFINKIFRGDRKIWMIFFLLCMVSIIAVFSASSTLTFRGSYWAPIMKHGMFLFGGTVVVTLASAMKPKLFTLSLVGMPIVWALLIAVKFAGERINGAERVLTVFGFQFQPSELAKVCLIGTVAFFLTKYKTTQKEIFYKISVWTSIITCGIIMLDNLSTAILIYGVIIILLFTANISFKKICKLLLYSFIAAVLFIVFVCATPENTLKNVGLGRAITWKARVERFLGLDNKNAATDNNSDADFQENQARIALANGGLFGKFPGNGTQRNVLPQAYSDFIYAIIIEETGLVGGLFVLGLYIWLFVQAGSIARRSEKLFPKLLVMGSAFMLTVQALTNMGVAVGLFPVTGQPLPLLSRGGTSTIVTCAFIGIILSVSRFENKSGIKRDDEIEEEMEEQKQAVLAEQQGVVIEIANNSEI
jgi:cell division protein FtsW